LITDYWKDDIHVKQQQKNNSRTGTRKQYTLNNV